MPDQRFTYSGDPSSSPNDELRFLLQDTSPAMPLLSDTEVQYLLDRWLPLTGSVTYAASVGASIVSRKFAGVVSVSADGVTVNVADLSKRYADLAMALRAEATAGSVGGAVDLSNIMVGSQLDDDIAPLVFGIGMHDNSEAGQQDYGGTLVPVIEWPDR